MKDVLEELAAARRAMGTATLPAGEAYTMELRRRYDAHLNDVWDAITNPERLSRWMKPVTGDLRLGGGRPRAEPKWLRGLVLHGTVKEGHGQVGHTSRVVLQIGKQRIEATETITRLEPADLHEVPSSVIVYYEREIATEGMWEAQRDQLIETSPDTTLWESESEFRFQGLLMRLVGLAMPGSFRKQSQRHMQDFKEFAEHGTDVRTKG